MILIPTGIKQAQVRDRSDIAMVAHDLFQHPQVIPGT